jgi:hypothetical protein
MVTLGVQCPCGRVMAVTYIGEVIVCACGNVMEPELDEGQYDYEPDDLGDDTPAWG